MEVVIRWRIGKWRKDRRQRGVVILVVQISAHGMTGAMVVGGSMSAPASGGDGERRGEAGEGAGCSGKWGKKERELRGEVGVAATRRVAASSWGGVAAVRRRFLRGGVEEAGRGAGSHGGLE